MIISFVTRPFLEGRCCVASQTYMLNQCTLVLECVALTQVVQLVVQVLVDLAGGTVLDEEAAKDS